MAYQPQADTGRLSPDVTKHSDLEVVHKYAGSSDQYFGGYPRAESGPPTSDPPKRKIFGLPRRILVIIILGIIAIIVGTVVGAVLGTRPSSNGGGSNEKAAAENGPINSVVSSAVSTAVATTGSATATSSSTSSSATPTPTSAALKILSAVYVAEDVTEGVRSEQQEEGSIFIDMTNKGVWAEPDPWFNQKKCLAVVYGSGSDIRTFVATEGDGDFTFTPEEPGDSSHTQKISRQGPSDDGFAIVSVVWGPVEITDASVYETIYEYRRDNTAITFTNDFFGADTFFREKKSGVIFYTTDNFETISYIAGKENSESDW